LLGRPKVNFLVADPFHLAIKMSEYTLHDLSKMENTNIIMALSF